MKLTWTASGNTGTTFLNDKGLWVAASGSILSDIYGNTKGGSYALQNNTSGTNNRGFGN